MAGNRRLSGKAWPDDADGVVARPATCPGVPGVEVTVVDHLGLSARKSFGKTGQYFSGFGSHA